MNIAIVSNLKANGLRVDYDLLRDFLSELGHTVFPVQWDEEITTFAEWPPMDLTIFLEVIPQDKLAISQRRFAFLNPEWCKPEVIQAAQRHIEKIFAKTHEAYRIFSELFPGKTHYTGFLTRDQYMPEIEQKPWFLHIGGNSSLRGTEAVVDAWAWKKNGLGMDAHLIVISSAFKDRPQLPMVTYHEHVSEEELKSYQNECLFHLYPSGTEGFGHALHEALSVNAMILTTKAPPMNEIRSAYKVPYASKRRYNLGDVYEVSALDIHKAAREMLWYGKRYGSLLPGRDEFLKANSDFRESFAGHLREAPTKKMRQAVPKRNGSLQIAFLGNFEAPESTENMVKWALEEGLGHSVWEMQENKASLADLCAATTSCDLFLWVRTPGWLQLANKDMEDVLTGFRSMSVPTVSLHLDKFWGIPDREKLIGEHPFWKTQFVWTADGSRQEDFKKKGVNHYWMRPAVSEVYCHPGTPREEYRCDVGFVGAKGYHAEYPFRRQLLDFLETRYGADFKHITNLRGHGLNDFYASCKVVVGDCIFSGTPHYWSDRVPETCGRYGFLLHPNVVGLDIPVSKYEAQNLQHLEYRIDQFLADEAGRREQVKLCADWVRLYDTWTVRMREILEVVHESEMLPCEL